ncbi:MAG: heparan-alpha-glucosaminide N-acetyltransferase domain-containing protein [Gemmatimonas sp.]
MADSPTSAARVVSSSSNARVVSIDVLRGLTVAGMLLVNDPGDPDNVFAPFRHSVWNGCTFADLVFPYFLFLVGITTHLSLSRRASNDDGGLFKAVFRRSAIIFGLGLLLNAYPFFEKTAIAGPSWLPAFFGHIAARLELLRLTGVLQRIAIAYFAASLIVWKASTRRVVVVAAVLLLWYWATMTLLHVPGEGDIGAHLLQEPGRTLAAWFDRTMLDWTRWGLGWHMWDRAVPYDPEGLLSTVPAIATVLLGVLAGRWLQSARAIGLRLQWLGYVGATAMLIGLAWHIVFPINKPLWTSSYVMFTAGAACVTLAIIGWLVDVKQWKQWATPFLVFGTNPIVAYVGGELLANILRSSIKFKVDGQRVSTGLTLVRELESIGIEARVASLMWALLFVVICYLLVLPLYRRRMFLRV